MGLLAVKHLDPVVGIDVHSVLVAPSPTPVFLPHPHVGFMLDLREYVEAAKGVVGSIAMALVQEKVSAYLEDHPDVETQLSEAAAFASGKLADIQDNAIVAEGMKLEQQAAAFQSSIGNAIGAGAGMGGAAGRPIFVNGLMRATVGTHSFHVPGLHFPLGESFAPPPEPDPIPSDDAESFMGSRTVLANNDPMSFMALPALSCWAVGMEPPGHNSAHTERTYPSMPSSVMLPIPAGRPVMVGGPPVLNMAAAAKGLFKAFQGSKWAKSLADKLNLKSGFLRCKVLKAEPVDALSGEVVVHGSDFTVPGRLPLVWDRCYASQNPYSGSVGLGWQTPADIRLELMLHEGRIGVVSHFPDHTTAFDDVPSEECWSARTCDWQRGYALYNRDGQFVLRTKDSIEYGFILPAKWRDTVAELGNDSSLTLRVDSMADLSGNAWEFVRDEYGRLQRVVEWKLDEKTMRMIVCDSDQQLQGRPLEALTLIDSEGSAYPLVRYEYDDQHNLIASIDAMAHPHRFEYAAPYGMVSHTTARGVSFHYSYQKGSDGVWRVDRAWGKDGLLDYRFFYDRMRQETRIVDSLNHVTTLQLNERHMPIMEVDALGGITSYRYDERWRANAETNPAGQTISWKYDRYGNVTSQTLPNGTSIYSRYNENNQLTIITSQQNQQWIFEWDGHGNLIEKQTPENARWQYAYDVNGQLVTHIGPRGAVTRFDYDQNGNLSNYIDAVGNVTRYIHDALGNLRQTINALGQISHYDYDRNGNLTRATESDGQEIQCAYDADGNLVRYCDPAGHVTQMTYSDLGQIEKRLAPDGSTLEYQYDSEEQLAGVLNERGQYYELRRDALGRIIEEIDYWGQSTRYEYANSGYLIRSIDPLDRAIIYQVDNLGRIVQKHVQDPTAEGGVRVETFSYDNAGNMISAENPDGRIELRYDAAGRVIEERQGNDFIIQNSFDAAGNRIKRKTSLTAFPKTIVHTIAYEYDAMNAVVKIKIDENESIEFVRDALGQIRVENLAPELNRQTTYTASGLLAKQTILAGTGALFSTEYAYDTNGEMIERRDSKFGFTGFQYDPVGRLTSQLDPFGRMHRFLSGPLRNGRDTDVRNTMAGTYLGTSSHSLEAEHNGCRYIFDQAGNLTLKQDAQRCLMLKWDGDGQLIETHATRIELPEGGVSYNQSNTRTQYTYDVFHRRVKKASQATCATERHSDPASQKTSYYFWDGETLVSEINISTTSPRRPDSTGYDACEWVYYPGTFRPFACILHTPVTSSSSKFYRSENGECGSASDVYFFYNDPSGVPVRVVDKNGTIEWESEISGWEAIKSIQSRNKFQQPLRFQGQYHDCETDLYYTRHRYYDPDVGRFISQDPIKLLGGIDLYRYGLNPFTWIDPLGLLVSYLPLDRWGRPTGVDLDLTVNDLRPTGTSPPTFDPPGWVGGTHPDHQQRSHLAADSLGGSGSRRENLVTLSDGTNNPGMSKLEGDVRRYLRANRSSRVHMEVRAIYDRRGRNRIPRAITMSAVDTNTGHVIFSAQSVLNGRRQNTKCRNLGC
ncbi:RHS repeat-associated core domain-containing protein [Burkholderia anthina]|uniref:RHS repeat-associated core domain-containing protein n=1 Tax=Burkholderia anthina TaxID=179879 RepID=UPI001AA0A06D|nr:RHS repeat-associated core domain-containing protein [Burkholderia anthina]QTD94242.1 DNA/RNA non-specific endonuclease [Burkholderia anthina]